MGARLGDQSGGFAVIHSKEDAGLDWCGGPWERVGGKKQSNSESSLKMEFTDEGDTCMFDW